MKNNSNEKYCIFEVGINSYTDTLVLIVSYNKDILKMLDQSIYIINEQYKVKRFFQIDKLIDYFKYDIDLLKNFIGINERKFRDMISVYESIINSLETKDDFTNEYRFSIECIEFKNYIVNMTSRAYKLISVPLPLISVPLSKVI